MIQRFNTTFGGRHLVVAWMVIVLTPVIIVAAVREPVKARRAVALLDRTLTKVNRQAYFSGYPTQGWPDPYSPVLNILDKDHASLPKIWQARAMAQYAVYLGSLSPLDNRPHSHAWYLRKEEAILLQAVAISPRYATGWAILAFIHRRTMVTGRHQVFDRYLAAAIRANPLNPYANALRALEIMNTYFGHGLKPGLFKGNLGFQPAKWSTPFCYRVLVFMNRKNMRKRGGEPKPAAGSVICGCHFLVPRFETATVRVRIASLRNCPLLPPCPRRNTGT